MENEGTITNINTSETEDSDTEGARARFLWKPSERFKMLLTYETHEGEFRNTVNEVVRTGGMPKRIRVVSRAQFGMLIADTDAMGTPESTLVVAGSQEAMALVPQGSPVTLQNAATGLGQVVDLLPDDTFDDRVQNISGSGRDNENESTVLHLDWQLSDRMALASITAASEFDRNGRQGSFNEEIAGEPYGIQRIWGPLESSESLSQELRLTYEADTWTSIIGLYYSDTEDEDYTEALNAGESIYGTTGVSAPLRTAHRRVRLVPIAFENKREIEDMSIFNQNIFRMSEKAELTIGWRWLQVERNDLRSLSYCKSTHFAGFLPDRANAVSTYLDRCALLESLRTLGAIRQAITMARTAAVTAAATAAGNAAAQAATARGDTMDQIMMARTTAANAARTAPATLAAADSAANTARDNTLAAAQPHPQEFPRQKNDWDAVTASVKFNYRLHDTVSIYASFDQGFKAGGPNVLSATSWPDPATSPLPAGYKEETSDAYELGLKGDFLNRRLRWNAALFYQTFDDYQVEIQDPETGIGNIIRNAAGVEIKGMESELTWLVNENLLISVNLAYIDSRFESFENAGCHSGQLTQRLPTASETAATGLVLERPTGSACTLTRVGPLMTTLGTQDVSGEPLNLHSPWSGNLFAQYSWNSPEGNRWYLYGEAVMRDSRIDMPDRDPASRAGGYVLYNAGFGVSAPNRRWEVSLWGKNLADRDYVLSYRPGRDGAVGVDRGVGAIIGPARAFGTSIKINF